ncbi:hypothetical protein [Streptomyces sp. 891-h]|uniref:hypothetical protein n=1 Tax=Streptomyces sp. 891-h TaxID=2720714 RepID=UPI001FAA8874|nr:hypothetical protein [Streptomyces sp. 891-h]
MNKDQVWVHGERITDGHVTLDMRAVGVFQGLSHEEINRDGQWVLRKAAESRWVSEAHPDLSDAIPAQADEPGWSAVAWSSWVTRGVRVGAVNGRAVAVDHAWLSRLQAGYRVEGASDSHILRIVREDPTPVLLPGGLTTHRTVVGIAVPQEIGGASAVVEAIVDDLER